jgi:putative redox protein
MTISRVLFVDGMQFVGTSESGHAVIMDAPLSVGGNNTGPTPMELILSALGGCTGMDVISILRKKKQNVKRFELQVKGEKSDTHPKKYTSIHIEYIVSGTKVREDAVKRAVELSLEKYCSVGAMLVSSAVMTHSYKIIQD